MTMPHASRLGGITGAEHLLFTRGPSRLGWVFRDRRRLIIPYAEPEPDPQAVTAQIAARRARAKRAWAFSLRWVARPARQAPRRRGSLPGRARRPRAGRSRRGRLLSARRAAGRVPRDGRDGQRNWQTVYPGSRTSDPSTSPANLPANTGSCRQRSPLSAADTQDVAGINLPVDSQTGISAQLLKQ